MLQKFVKALGGDPNKREIEKLSELVEVINGLEPDYEALSDEELCAKTDVFRIFSLTHSFCKTSCTGNNQVIFAQIKGTKG